MSPPFVVHSSWNASKSRNKNLPLSVVRIDKKEKVRESCLFYILCRNSIDQKRDSYSGSSYYLISNKAFFIHPSIFCRTPRITCHMSHVRENWNRGNEHARLFVPGVAHPLAGAIINNILPLWKLGNEIWPGFSLPRRIFARTLFSVFDETRIVPGEVWLEIEKL